MTKRGSEGSTGKDQLAQVCSYGCEGQLWAVDKQAVRCTKIGGEHTNFPEPVEQQDMHTHTRKIFHSDLIENTPGEFNVDVCI